MDQMDKVDMDTIRRRLSFLEMDNQIKLDELYALQKELEGGDEEGVENGSVRVGGDEIFNEVAIQGPEEKAMTNPLILSKIFPHLELSVIVPLRLVCKVWDEVAISQAEFSNRVYLHLPKLFPYGTVAPVPVINSKLTKNIYIMDRLHSMSGSELDDFLNLERLEDLEQSQNNAFQNLMTFFNQYHNVVENIWLKCDWGDCYLYHILLVKALSTLDFPILKRIIMNDKNTFLSYRYLSNWDKKAFISTMAPFATKPNLTSLQLEDTISGSPLHDIFQNLINCAPNLEEITIRGNFYPDLSTCKNLKTLSYSGIPIIVSFVDSSHYFPDDGVVEEPSFKLESLSKMLDQVKHSLIKLILEDLCGEGLYYIGYDNSQLEEFKFPDVLKKLEFLCIHENSGKPFFQPELKKLNPVQFPKLKRLCIGVRKHYSFEMYNPGVETLDDVVGGISHRFGTISSLHLRGTLSPDIRHRIPILFPNLMKLTMPWSVMKEDEKPDFDSVIDFCSSWTLQELDIGTALQSDWSSFMAGLGRLKHTHNDIRMLTLRVPTNDRKSFSSEKPMFDVWYDTKKQLQQVGTEYLNLQNLSFRPQSDVITKAVEEADWKILSEHSLRVFFV